MSTDTDTGSTARRTEGIRSQGRAERVVDAVMQAAALELGRVGYAGLRIEDVASLSGVNKTTIYRRWPTKADLVSAALRHAKRGLKMNDTGDLRRDLLGALREIVAFTRTPIGQGWLRIIHVERSHPEVEPICTALRNEHIQARHAIIERAILRGELPAGTDPGLIGDMVISPVYTRVAIRDAEVTEAYMQAVVDTVLAGARLGTAMLAEADTVTPP